jgi:predicted nucleotidyltransferase component of viral defense system
MGPLTAPHWEALTPETRQALQQVAELPFIDQFYLAGGTGLALHLGHRFSVDLDLFSAANAVGPDTRAVLREVFDDPTLVITHDKDGTFVATWQSVSISFFQLSSYPLVQEPVSIGGVPLATVEEIGAMKLAAITDRGTRKDLIDLYYILRQVSIERLFEVAAAKYPRARTLTITATRALAYFVDAEALPMPRMLDHTPWPTMKRFLEQQALAAGRQELEAMWS